MNSEWIRSGLDVVLIILVGVGLVQATRLIWHLAGLRASRGDMERFVRDFNTAVIRAETGIKTLKSAARESGDDLEKLVEKATMVRDELQFIVESADQLAERLSKAASSMPVPPAYVETTRAEPKTKPAVAPVTVAAPPAAPVADVKPAPEPQPSSVTPLTTRRDGESKPASRAEKELMQALQKLN